MCISVGVFRLNYLCYYALGMCTMCFATVTSSRTVTNCHCRMRILVAGPQFAQSQHKIGIGLSQSVSV